MRIDKKYVTWIENAQSASDLIPQVQNAIRLEHATIPPYLAGYFSLRDSNSEVADIIKSVVIEEMLHLTIAANLMISIGGSPVLNQPDFVPNYPHELPMGIGDSLEVKLKKCSREQVENVYMGIETPMHLIPIPRVRNFFKRTVKSLSRGSINMTEYSTIGAFYLALADKIEELGDSIFIGDVSNQVIARKWFPNHDEMFAITNVESAVKAIKLIIDQGEGTSTSPFDETGDISHYYRFRQIVEGKALIESPGSTPPFAYAGQDIDFQPEKDVWDMDDNPAIKKYKEGSMSRRMAEQFSYSYTKLLNSLHDAFNGNPDSLDQAMGLMYELKLLALRVLQTPAEWADTSKSEKKQTGLSFEYYPVNG